MKITPETTEDGRHLLHFQAEPGDLMTPQQAAESAQRHLLAQLNLTEIADFTLEDYEAAKRRYLESSRVPAYAKPQRAIGSFMGHPVIVDESLPENTFGLKPANPGHHETEADLKMVREKLAKANALIHKIDKMVRYPSTLTLDDIKSLILEYMLD